MIHRCILLISISWIYSCTPNNKSESYPEMIQVSFVDSLQLIEENNFFSKASQVELIGDSLIAVSSYLTPGIWFVNAKTGTIDFSIENKGILDISVFPSAFDISKFPLISILHPKLKSILIFDVVKQELKEKIQLQMPDNKTVRTVESYFLLHQGQYLVELYPLTANNSEAEFYNKAGNLIGLFNKEGKLLQTMVDNPKKLKRLAKPVMPFKTFAQSYNTENPLIAFPTSKEIIRLNPLTKKEEKRLNLPEKSRYFEFELASMEVSFDPNIHKHLDFPSSHFFYKIVENDRMIVIQTDMRDNNKLGSYHSNSHLFVYKKEENKWYETSDQFDQNQIGLLAGIARDTLYYYEGSLKKTENKYIKRIVLNN